MRDLRDNSNCKQLYQTLYLRAREEMFNTVISSILYLSAEKRRFLKGHSGICLVCFKGGSQGENFLFISIIFCYFYVFHYFYFCHSLYSVLFLAVQFYFTRHGC